MPLKTVKSDVITLKYDKCNVNVIFDLPSRPKVLFGCSGVIFGHTETAEAFTFLSGFPEESVSSPHKWGN